MPTVMIWRGHRFRFYSSDAPEPPHIHIVKDGKTAKVWLRSLKVAHQRGYSEQELNQLLTIVAEHRDEWIGAWNEFFGV